MHEMKNKAQMLEYLQQEIDDINILPVCIVNSRDFYSESDNIIEEIINKLGNKRYIVRSSSSDEDLQEYSNAGHYESILNVKPCRCELFAAIDKVYRSYNTSVDQDILIQPMLENIKMSGVVFTKDKNSGADYYIINYSEGNDTAAITSGKQGQIKTLVVYKNCVNDGSFSKLIESCQLIEQKLGRDDLDIEFGIDYSGRVYIFQVRYIAKSVIADSANISIDEDLNRICKKIIKLNHKRPLLLGNKTCFGVMPDWNPAEILGARPKRLAVSLYKELITDTVWAAQRDSYGYRDLISHPIMITFCGIPYIDMRVMFNSFIPAKIDKDIAEKLVNYYLGKIEKYPQFHDKVEFEIVYSCFYIGIDEDLHELVKHGFSQREIFCLKSALLELTINAVSIQSGNYKKDVDKLSSLEQQYNNIITSDLSIIDKIYWLIEVCKKYGTLPFAGIARSAFIAMKMLKAFVNKNIIRKCEYDNFLKSLNTISKQMSKDLDKLEQGEISKDEFLKIYGHVRPGTYDILSNRYDEDFEKYFLRKESISLISNNGAEFSFNNETLEKIQKHLSKYDIPLSSIDLIDFIRESVEMREKSKFMFTKMVSDILSLIGELAKRNNISKNDMANVDISVVKQLYADLYSCDVHRILMENIQINEEQYEKSLLIKLPSIINNPSDIYSFYLLDGEPNYITHKSVIANVTDDLSNTDLQGKIVFIKSADPGYDFIFTKGIAGLVTQFGGVNSHMAIRCSELGIPAVIGAGEVNYNKWLRGKRISVDCVKHKVYIMG